MAFITQGKTNWKFLLVVIILAIIVGGGTLWYSMKQKVPPVQLPELKKPEKVVIAPEVNLTTTKLATIPEGYRIVEGPIFSPDGKKVAYVAKQENKYFVVVNGKEGKVYDEIILDPPQLQFSPDSKKIVYIAKKDCIESKIEYEGKEYPIKTGCKEVVVVNGEEGKTYDDIETLVFSPDSQKLAYRAIKEKKFLMVVNDKEVGGVYDLVWYPIFSPDSQKLAYIAQKEEKHFVVVNGKEGKAYDLIHDIIFSPDGQEIAYVAETEDKYLVVRNGKEGKLYHVILGPPVFSPDGKKIAYVTREEKAMKFFMVVNEKEGERYDDVGTPVFSPDSQRLAYRAKKVGRFHEVIVGNERTCIVVVNGQEGKTYDDVWDPVFSPDSQKIAYRASRHTKEDAGNLVVIGGEETKVHVTSDSSTFIPIFSLDSQKIAYVDMENNKMKMLIVINGKKSKAYDRIFTKPKFTSDEKYIVYGAQSGNELWWEVYKVEEDKKPIYPDDYILKKDEVPLGFELFVSEGLAEHITGNPGFIDNEYYKNLFKGADPSKIEKFFISQYIKPRGQYPDTELGLFVIKFKLEENLNADLEKIKNNRDIFKEEQDAIFLKNKEILVIVWSDGNHYRAEVRQIADKLKVRLNLQEI
jgi:Tol biopolymer transport system component